MNPEERQNFCRIAAVSPQAVSQFQREGVFSASASTAVALAGYIAKLKSRETDRAAKARMLKAQALTHERRARRELRQVMTVAEIEQVFAPAIDRLHMIVQQQAAAAFSSLAPDVGNGRARVLAESVRDSMLGAAKGFRISLTQLLELCAAGLMPADERLDARMVELMAAVGEPTEAEPEAEPEAAEAPPAKPARRPRRGRAKGVTP